MKILSRPLNVLASSAALVAVLCAPVVAADADKVATRLKTLLDSQGVSIDFAEVEANGSDILLKGVSVGAPGLVERIQVGTVTLGDVEDFDGGYRVGVMSLPDYAFSQDPAAIVAEDLTIEGLRIPAEGGNEIFGDVLVYENMTVGLVTFKMLGEEAFVLEDASATIDIPDSADEKMVYSGNVARMYFNFEAFDDPNVQQTMKALGYDELNATVDMAGYWIPASGRMVLETNRIAVKDAASLDFQIDLSGYTPEFVAALQTMSKKMQSASDSEKQAQGLAMLGLMQQLSFHSALIRVDDASLTGRLLDFFAAQQGTDRANMVNQTKGVLPFLLSQLGNPDFAAQITKAASDYLDDPRSLEIRAAPDEPVPFAMLMATGMSAPQTLPDQLKVTVTANQ